MDVLTKDLSDASFMELFYADDLALCGESLDEISGKYERLNKVLKGKGLRVNVEKTKEFQLLYGKKSYVLEVDSCGDPCDEHICHNSICCAKF